jgi:ankyrin repeat protein
MSNRTTQSAIEKRGMLLLHRARQNPRFTSARLLKALIEAMQYGDEPLALWLLKHGADPRGADHKGRSALWWAAALKHSSVIRELVNRGARLPDDVLIGPVDAGDEKTVRFLIRRGANVNCIGSVYSPVGWFCRKQVLLTVAIGSAAHEPLLQTIPAMLIRAGAKVNRSILPSAVPGLQNRSMLGLAAFQGQTRTLEALLAAGADVNRRDNRGRTALFDALERGHIHIVETLLRAGARTDIKNLNGLTPADAVKCTEQSPEMIFTLAGNPMDEAQLEKQAVAWRRLRDQMLALLHRHSAAHSGSKISKPLR